MAEAVKPARKTKSKSRSKRAGLCKEGNEEQLSPPQNVSEQTPSPADEQTTSSDVVDVITTATTDGVAAEEATVDPGDGTENKGRNSAVSEPVNDDVTKETCNAECVVEGDGDKSVKSRVVTNDNPIGQTETVSDIPQPTPQATEQTAQGTEQTPQVTEQTSQVTEQTEQVTEQTAQVTDQTAQVTEQTAQVTEQIAQVTEQTAQVTEQIAQVAEQTAQVTEQTAQVTEQTAQVTEQIAQVAEQTPQVTEQSSQVTEQTPQVTEQTAQVAEQTPQVTEQTKQVTEQTAQVTEQSQQVTEQTAQVTEQSQQVTEHTPKQVSADSTPQPRAASETLQPIPQTSQQTPQQVSENSTPQASSEMASPSETGSVLRSSQQEYQATVTDVDSSRLVPQLYPRLDQLSLPHVVQSEAPPLVPLTEEHLRSIYVNHQLERHSEFVDNFLENMNVDSHPFYEMLLSYYRACNHLSGAEQDLNVLQSDRQRYSQMVWEMKQETMVVQGQCADKARVSVDHQYMVAVFNDAMCQDVSRALKNMRCHVHDQLSLYAYEVQLAKLQVESYLHNLFESSPQLSNLTQHSPVQAYLAHQRDVGLSQQVALLRTCVSILFMFHRKPSKDATFIQEARRWTLLLVSSLLRVASLEDHLFILHHILRCPPGVSKWAASLVQVVAPPVDSPCWENPQLDCMVTMLAAMLTPVRQREEGLYQMRVALTPSLDSTQSNPWIFVDSDGEEDEAGTECWWQLTENDVVSLLSQLPPHLGFQHILLRLSDKGPQSSWLHTETGFFRVVAYSTCLINLLGTGLHSFSLSRYRQLNKRIAGMIRHVVLYVVDYWDVYCEVNQCDERHKLQVEVDQVVYRAISHILTAHRLGSWQFLTDMPYQYMSRAMMWRLFILMHRGNCVHDDSDDGHYQFNEDPADHNPLRYQAIVQNEVNQAWFEAQLTKMPTNEATFLLTTFANMARSRPHSDLDLIEAITREIFEIAYLWSHTREFSAKPGRLLLSSILSQHPHVFSLVLEAVNQHMDKIGKVSLYLFQELPLHWCMPTSGDLGLLRDWLLEYPPSSPHSHLARHILTHLNWNSLQDGLGPEVHRSVAVLCVEAYQKHLQGKVITGLFTDGYSTAKGSEEQQLASWAWQLALKLHLHPRSHALIGQLPDLDVAPELLPINQALREKYALGGYLTVLLGKCGQTESEFLKSGVTILHELTDKNHYLPTLHLLLLTLPMFYNNPKQLTNNKLFMEVLQCILGADALKKSYFSSDQPGPVTKLLSGCVQRSVRDTEGSKSVVITFWISLLTSVPGWISERSVLFALDSLVLSSFSDHQTFSTVILLFRDLHKEAVQCVQQQGVLSSIFSWLGGSSAPSLLPPTASSCPWLSYVILLAETWWQDNTRIWPELQKAIPEQPDQSVEVLLKRVVSRLQVEQQVPVSSLCIYRWSQLALDTAPGHPALPLIWQQFFLLYLGRATPDPGLPQRGSVGEKLFHSAANVSVIKSMKKRLEETAGIYHGLSVGQSAAGQGAAGQGAAGQSEDDGEETRDDTERIPFYRGLVSFYQTLLYWLDEPRLHEANLYLPALPPQYDPHRLLTAFQADAVLWRDLVECDWLSDSLSSLDRHWTVALRGDANTDPPLASPYKPVEERFLQRLQKQPPPQPPPPIDRPHSPLVNLDQSLFTQPKALSQALRSNFCALVEQARLSCLRVSRHVGLDLNYIELLPDLYSNDMTESVVTGHCRSTFNITHKCKGPAVINFQHPERRRNEVTNRKIDENRAEYNQLLLESCLPPPLNVCASAVQVENTVTSLINFLRGRQSQSTRAAALDAGTQLFYQVAMFVSEDTKYYPPTRQFFAYCMEVLGQEFISGNPSQSQPLLQAILAMPGLTGLLSPLFIPNANPQLFISMYQDMLPVPANQGPEVAFTLLSKFDVAAWLGSASLSDRSSLVSVVTGALCDCGPQVPDNLALVFQIYRRHLQHLLKHNFPDHFGEILKLLIHGCEQQVLSVQVLDDFGQCLGVTEDDHSTSSIATQFSPSLLTETIAWLAQYFMDQRTSSTEAVGFGLYPEWKLYVPFLAALFGFLTKYNIQLAVATAKTSRGDTEMVIQQLWERHLQLFAPWIHPLLYKDQVVPPCVLSDIELASVMFTPWLHSIHYTQTAFEDMIPAYSQSALSLLWPFYVERLALKTLPDHVLQLYHLRLSDLPWHKLRPDLASIKLMLKVRSGQYPASSCLFLGRVVTSMSWLDIVHHYHHTEIAEVVTLLHGHLFTLCTQLATQEQTLEETPLPRLLASLEGLDWSSLSAVDFEEAVTWFLGHCEPRCVLPDVDSKLSQILSLVKVASAMVVLPNTVHDEEAVKKRCCYVQCVVQLVSKCSHLKTTEPEQLPPVLINLLTDIQEIINNGGDSHQALLLSQHSLSVLNTCNPQGSSVSALLSSLLTWLRSNPYSTLLLPLLRAACRVLVSHAHMLQVVEAVCTAHFTRTNVEQTEGCGWAELLSSIELPELARESFVEAAAGADCHLSLYAWSLLQLPLSQSLSDERAVMDRLVDVLHTDKPTSSVGEAKRVLVWSKVLELMLRQLDYGTETRPVVSVVLRLVPALSVLSQDRTSAGIMGALGLGKKSPLSIEMRLLCRAMAAFLAAQVPVDTSLRQHPRAPGALLSSAARKHVKPSVSPSQSASNLLSQLEAMLTNKSYTNVTPHVQYAINFITDPDNCVRDAPAFLRRLTTCLFPRLSYLAIIHHNVT